MTESKSNAIIEDCKELVPFRTINLINSDEVMICDAEDYEKLSKYNWRLNNGRAIAFGGKRGVYVYAHRIVMNAPNGMTVDHKNHNQLDNRKDSLRLCTHYNNTLNRRAPKNNTSGYKGVSFSKERNLWECYITNNGKRINLGRHETALEAAKIYDRAAYKLHGEFACLNFEYSNGIEDIDFKKCVLGKRNTLGYRGVTKAGNGFLCQFSNKEIKFSKYLKNPLDAALLYDEMAKKYNGDKAILNFN